MRHNLLIDSQITAIYAVNADRIQIRENRIVRNEGNGIYLWSTTNSSAQDNFISGANKGVYLHSNSQENRIRNNAVVNALGRSDTGIHNATGAPLTHKRAYFGLLNGSPSANYTGTTGSFDASSTEVSRPNPFKPKKVARMKWAGE